MKRPILIITLGFVTGITLGLYLIIAPFIFVLLIIITLFFKIYKIQLNKDYKKILYIGIKNNIILTFFVAALISNIYLMFFNIKIETIYKKFNNTEIIATVISNNKETEYKNTYKIEVEGYNGVNLILRISKNKKIDLNYGDKIEVSGEYVIPEDARNYGGFSYKQYLKTQDIYGIFEADRVKVIQNNKLGLIELFSNKVKLKIIENTNKILPSNTSQLFLGILIGYDENLSEDILVSFKKSNLTHLLAVSGAHIAYIIVSFTFLLSKLEISKKVTNIITILFLIFFMYITDFSASVVRAAIMGIIYLFSLILFRKNDIQTTISLSVLIILIDNPYKLLDIGLLLSYFATIGIICFTSLKRKTKIENELSLKQKIIKYVKDLALITIYANVFIIPIMIYNFNTISLTFVISNIIAGILIGPITIGGFILILISFINFKIACLIGAIYNLLLEVLIKATKLTSLIPLSEILVPTPDIILIFIYYLILFLWLFYIFLNKEYSNRFLVKKISNFIRKTFTWIKKEYKKIVIYILVFSIIINLITLIIPNNLNIYFIDVGQGDSTLIITPTNKSILIDSGGAETGSFDVGEKTLVPYLLDRKIIALDYICISHFDSDHCDGFKYLLDNIKVRNIILSKQYELTKNFEAILNIANKKKINILRVEEGDILSIDKKVKFRILSPGKVLSNDINDNSIVMKLEYNKFSCLFTGDISKNIEQNLVKKYGNNLKSDILKVAHHGSKTSSDKAFIQEVNPKISLIGVGKNNKFGHPNKEVIKILENINSKIYRTDLNGEISLQIKSGEIRVNSYIKKMYNICFFSK